MSRRNRPEPREILPDPDGTAGPQTSPETVYEYDSNGNRVRVTDARNNSTFYRYDKRNRQIEVNVSPFMSCHRP